MSALATLFHLIAVAHFYFGLFYYLTYVNEAELKFRKYKFAGILVYLTFLTFVSRFRLRMFMVTSDVDYCFQIIQAVYFTIALLNDLIGSNKPTTAGLPFIRKLRDYIFGSFAFPLAIDVGGLFWLLYAIDRALVFPIALDAFFPWWLNHFVHTNILAFVFLEMFLLFHKYPSRKLGLGSLSVFMIAYLVWVHIIKYKTNIWVYPVLAVLNWPQRIGFYIFTMAVPVAFYYFGEFVNNLTWNVVSSGEGQRKSTKAK